MSVEADEAKAEGMARVDAHANEQWKDDMMRCVLDTAARMRHFTTDAVVRLAIARGQWDGTHEKRALGPIMRDAAKLGVCRKANVAPVNSDRRSLHASPLSVWESLKMTKYKLGKVDLSQIECRILNTLAGQWDVIDKFRTGVDIYSELASQFYGFPVDKSRPAERGTGKQLELSCGYGAGGPTIVRTARAGTYGPPVHLTQQQGLQARDLYRRTHPFVTALWERGAQALWALHAGHRQGLDWGPPGQSEPCIEIRDRRIFHVDSGLWLDFSSLERHRPSHDPALVEVYPSYGEEVWRHRVREGWRKTYGARLIENIVQWLARIVISDAMKRILAMGYRIPLTVHDDVFILIPANAGELSPEQHLARCNEAVAQTLAWMPACPIATDPKLLDALDE